MGARDAHAQRHRWPRADGTYEFNCYSLYQSYSSGLPYVLADGRCYDSGALGTLRGSCQA